MLPFCCYESARRGSNPRPPPWQGGAPPLSHSLIVIILQRIFSAKRVMGIEPTYPAWKAGVLPLNYTRIYIKQSTHLNNYLYRIVSCECPEPESNQRHEDFQSSALPTELSGLIGETYFVCLFYTTLVFYLTK